MAEALDLCLYLRASSLPPTTMMLSDEKRDAGRSRRIWLSWKTKTLLKRNCKTATSLSLHSFVHSWSELTPIYVFLFICFFKKKKTIVGIHCYLRQISELCRIYLKKVNTSHQYQLYNWVAAIDSRHLHPPSCPAIPHHRPTCREIILVNLAKLPPPPLASPVHLKEVIMSDLFIAAQ